MARSTRTPGRLLAAGGVLVLTGLAAAPASAAAVVSRSDASAATINGQGTGSASATYDGQESRSGQTDPPLSLLGGQQFLSAGVLTQQATAGDGFSAACSGFAGTSGSVVQIGDGSCLRGGNAVDAGLGTLRLSDLELVRPDGALDPTNPAFEALDPATKALLGNVGPAVDEALAAAEDQGGNFGLVAGFGTIEGRCRVDNGNATGSATLLNTGVRLEVPGQDDIVLASFDTAPAPNTRVFTDLSKVIELVVGAVEDDLKTSLTGALAPLGDAVGAVRAEIEAGVREQVETQLAPLEDSLLRITLNEQSRPTSDSIRVTALHAEVLPAAQQAVGAPVADIRIGNANCGPADRVPAEAAAPPAKKKAVPELPTAVSAGVEKKPGATATPLSARLLDAAALGALGLTGLLIAGAGVVGLRRRIV